MKNTITFSSVLCFILVAISVLVNENSAQAQCSGQPTAGTVSSVSIDTLCPGSSARLKLNGFTAAAGIQFRWQMMPFGLSVWSNAGGNDSAATLTSQPISGTTWFRCYVTCANSGLSDTSLAFEVYSPGLLSVNTTGRDRSA